MLKRKLLLADDSITIQKVVNLTFADEGIDVITVGDGDSAMAKISELTPDVVLADVHMPGLSGYQVCEMVRANEATRELPVVLLVGSFEPFDENEAARVGANAFLTKPFQSIRQLVSQVSDLMQSASSSVAPAVAETPMPEVIPVPEMEISEPMPVAETTHEVYSEPTSEKIPDTTDIDSLYMRSVGDGPSDEEHSSAFVDAGMDDEMIETVHAEQDDDYNEQPSENGFAFEPSSGGFEQPATVEYDQEPTAEYQQSEYQQPVETSYQQSEYQQPVDTSYQQSDYQQPVETSYQEQSYQQPTETIYHEPEATEFHEPNVASFEQPVDYSYQQPTESTFEEAAPPTPPSPFDSPAEPHVPFDPSADPIPSLAQTISGVVNQASSSDEDVLDLPPMDQAKTIEFTTNAQTGGKEVVSLSPELMDLLVAKVVKQLSNKE